MSRRVAILRPEPGNAATAARVRDAGLDPLALPLFDVKPLAWTPPDPAGFDGLLLTSANAVRHAGSDLAVLRALPVLAVGPATAAAATAAGLRVIRIGTTDAETLLRDSHAFTRLLWLAGRDRTHIEHPALVATIPVYESVPLTLSEGEARALRGCVALVHSARAAIRLTHELARHAVPQAQLRIASISDSVATAAGPGWEAVAIAAAPNDHALIAAAGRLAIDP